ncbi:MAG TPA: hypothetical protein DCZ03_15125 [Gammaproteobacteria bacterium]|nr:hypothetical protein [Gammaproteobacteria bacterium]
MDIKYKSEWVEAAIENFQSALDTDNKSLAEDIIHDTVDAGFLSTANQMRVKLTDLNNES